ncbi:MAG: PAS domain S-box protein [Methanolinea sp.]|nr:PAS domain S-box protein [Methanolinea sp.]
MEPDRPYSVLYVDDDQDLLYLGKTFLERTGKFSVDTIDSAQCALEMIEHTPFDAVISDYQMPSMNGIEFLKTLRSRKSEVPFIIFTGKGREEVVIDALNAGADFYLQKGGDPKVQFAELAHKVSQAVQKRWVEQSLIQSKKRLADIIDFLPDATFAIDTSGAVIAWNRAMEEMTGTGAAAVLGKDKYQYSKVFYGEPRPMLIDLVLSPDEYYEQEKYLYTRRDSTTLTAETVLHREKGKTSHYWGKASCLYDENGQISGAIESIRDITERVAAENDLKEKTRELDLFFQNAIDLLCIADTGGYFRKLNPEWERTLGYTLDELEGNSFLDFVHPDDHTSTMRAVEQLARGEAIPNFVNRYRAKDGTYRWIEWRSFPHGDIIYAIARDITHRLHSENALRESEEKYRTLVEEIRDGFFIVDTQGVVTYANRRVAEMFGVQSAEEITGTHFSLYFPPPEKEMVLALLTEFLKNGDIPDMPLEIEALRKDGSRFLLEMKAFPITEGLRVTGIRGVIRDITARKEANEQLRILAQLVDIAPASITIHDFEGNFLYANQKTFDLHGYTREEFFSLNLHHLDAPESEALIQSRIQSLMKTGEGDFDVRHFKKDGTLIPLHVMSSLTKWHGKMVLMSIATDLTERLLAEQERRESEEKYRRIVDTAHEGIWAMDENFITSYVNTPLAETLGYTPDEMIGRSIESFMAKEEKADNRVQLLERMKGRPGSYERTFLHRDGSIRIMNVSATPIVDAEGVFRGSFAMLTDITEERRVEKEFRKEHDELIASYEQLAATEEELRQMLDDLRDHQEALAESEERYRRLMATTFDAMAIHREGKIIFVNEVAARLMGASNRAEIEGKDTLDLVHPDSRNEVVERIARMTSDPDGVMPPIEEKFIRLDGQVIDAEVIATSVIEKGERAFLVIFRDISERKRVQEALVQANRKLNLLNSITRHDIRNKMSVLAGHITLAKSITQDDCLVRCMDRQMSAVGAVQQILEFTRDYQDLGLKEPQWHSFEGTFARVRGQVDTGQVDLKVDKCQFEVFADPLLEKVFYTILDNAIRYGEHLTRILVGCTERGDELVVSFEDDGVGIPDQEKEKIFEKGYGKGTGLGLFLAREILSITGMAIRETGTSGEGARFEITIPKGMWR